MSAEHSRTIESTVNVYGEMNGHRALPPREEDKAKRGGTRQEWLYIIRRRAERKRIRETCGKVRECLEVTPIWTNSTGRADRSLSTLTQQQKDDMKMKEKETERTNTATRTQRTRERERESNNNKKKRRRREKREEPRRASSSYTQERRPTTIKWRKAKRKETTRGRGDIDRTDVNAIGEKDEVKSWGGGVGKSVSCVNKYPSAKWSRRDQPATLEKKAYIYTVYL